MLAIAGTGPALASTAQQTVVEDSGRILAWDPIARDTALDEARDLGADIIKIPVLWGEIAPERHGHGKPKIDLTDSAAYPEGAWARLDAAVYGAQVRGMQVWLMITAPAPRWAVARRGTWEGAYKPDPEAFGEFVTAVSARYPAVAIWSMWNEPNLSRFLQPQTQGGVVVSAVHYRKLYRAGVDALNTTGNGGDTILFGEMLPRAPQVQRGENSTVPPVKWLREFLCLDGKLRPLRGGQARRRECDDFVPLQASGMAYHPYTTKDGPGWYDAGRDNATISHLSRIYRVLDAASRHRHLAARRLRIYNSEFGYQSAPPDRQFAPLRKVPAFLNASEYLSYRDSRLATYSQYLLVDDLSLDGFQSGLRFSSGRPKPGVYQSFALPVLVIKRGNSGALVWGCLRAKGPEPETALVQVKGRSRRYQTVKRVNVRSANGCFTVSVRVSRAPARVFRVLWGATVSRSTRPVAAPKRFR